MVMVSTLNGKITRENDSDIYTWTSKEDQKFFFTLLKKNTVMIMGSNTYEAAKKRIRLTKKRLRIVLTKYPKKYSHDAVYRQLEFSSESPQEIVKRLKKNGYKKLLILGGGKVNSSFLKAGLADELYVTMEPIIFGKGKNIFEEGIFENKLQLISIKKMNKRGTLLLKYKLLT